MKRLIFFTVLAVFAMRVFATQTSIDLTKFPVPPPPPVPNSLTQEVLVSATISEIQLEVYFDSFVGDATITVYDANDNVVSQETVDTDSTSEVFIATDAWASGNYTIKITYQTTSLSGVFLVE